MTDDPEVMKAAVEVAAVKAQAQAIIRRVRNALDELSETIETFPEEEVHDADHSEASEPPRPSGR